MTTPTEIPVPPPEPVAPTRWEAFRTAFHERRKVYTSALIYKSLRLLTRALSALPLAKALSLGRALGTLAYLVARRHRPVVLAEMARCFPGDSREEVKDHLHRVFKHMGMNAVEVFRWVGGCSEEMNQNISVVGAEHMKTALARGRGALVLTAHTGNWDLMGLWCARRFPLTIISKALREPGINRFWMEARAASGLQIVPARKSYRACLSVLKKQGLLGFVLDQNTKTQEGVFVDFCGKPACTTPGLAFLPAHAQAPVVPVFMFRQLNGQHKVHVMPLIEPPATRDEEAITRATQQYTRIIEDVVRRHPDQWIWMHRRWRSVPQEKVEQQPTASGPIQAEELA